MDGPDRGRDLRVERTGLARGPGPRRRPPDCNLDLVIEDIRAELRGLPSRLASAHPQAVRRRDPPRDGGPRVQPLSRTENLVLTAIASANTLPRPRRALRPTHNPTKNSVRRGGDGPLIRKGWSANHECTLRLPLSNIPQSCGMFGPCGTAARRKKPSRQLRGKAR
jgi:hypothetical protein